MSEYEEELELIDRVRAGDGGAFGALLDRYESVVYNLALRMVGSREDAQDITQGVFAKAFQKLDTFDRRNRFFSWLYRIAIHECLNHRRSRRTEEALSEQVPDPADPPDRAAERAELVEQVRQAVLRIPETYRQVIVLRHFLNLSHEEMGEVLEIPPKTVKSRLHTARSLLGEILAKQGLGTV